MAIERHDERRGSQRRRQLRHGHRADVAERLAEEDVGPRRGERPCVEMERALAALDRRADLAIDREAVAAGRDRRARDARKRADGGRVVAVVSDRDELVARAERVRDLGAGRDEGHDAHPRRLVR